MRKLHAKNSQIQALRGLLCLMIMVFHYTCRYSNIYGHEDFFVVAFQNFTFIALMGFLCLSGFFVDGKGNETGLKFFGGKLKRLYPAYLVAITIIFLLHFTGFLGPERDISLQQYLLNIPFLNVLTRTGFVDGAHWYVVFLLLIYFVFGYIRKLKIYYKEEFCIINEAIILFVLLILYLLNKQETKLIIYLNYYFSFSVGLGIKRYQDKMISTRGQIVSGMLMAAYIFFSRTIELSLITLATFTIMYLVLNEKVRILDSLKPLIILGDRSYLIYLIHQSLGFMVINCLISVGVKDVLICVIIAMMTTVVLSFIVSSIMRKIKIRY